MVSSESLKRHHPNLYAQDFRWCSKPISTHCGRPKLCSFIINEWMMMGVLGAYTIRNFTYARLLKKGVFISIVLSYTYNFLEASPLKNDGLTIINYVALIIFTPGPYFQLFLY